MHRFDCPDHGRLALDLARGRLEDDAALEAEEAVRGCAACQGWWTEALEPSAEVDAAVSRAFATFAPPRAILRPWLAAAAAILVVVAGSTVWQLVTRVGQPGHPPNPRASRPAAIFASSLDPDDLSTWKVESGSAAGAVQRAAAVEHDEGLFVSGLESGDLSSWRFVSGDDGADDAADDGSRPPSSLHS